MGIKDKWKKMNKKKETAPAPAVDKGKPSLPPKSEPVEKDLVEKLKVEEKPKTKKPEAKVLTRTYVLCLECKKDTKGILKDCKSCNNTRKQLKEWTEEVT